MNPSVKILTPYSVSGQSPLDAKSFFVTHEELIDLKSSNQRAFTYYDGLIVYCVETKKRYQWRERKEPETTEGELANDFQYPNGHTSFGVDYSNKFFNFFEFFAGDLIIVKEVFSFTVSITYGDNEESNIFDLSSQMEEGEEFRGLILVLVNGAIVPNYTIDDLEVTIPSEYFYSPDDIAVFTILKAI